MSDFLNSNEWYWRLARAVIRGDYGNGETRKQKLGSLYSAVQKRVNEMLS